MFTPLSSVGSGAGGGGSTPISLKKTVWLETAANGGNDATGQVGVPSKPFATPNAAVAALFAASPSGQVGLINVGIGVFATLNFNTLGTSGLVNLAVRGMGAAHSGFAVNWTNGNHAIRIQDVGFKSVNFTSIYNVGVGQAQAAEDADGVAGGHAGSVLLIGCYVGGDVQCYGGQGGFGGDAVNNPTNGAAGGNGGFVTCEDCTITGVIAVMGGFGGEHGSDLGGGVGSGGQGGQGGVISLLRTSVSALYAQGGGRGNDADDGGGGAIQLAFSDNTNEADISGGNGSGPGGQIEIWMSRQGLSPTGADSTVIHGSVVAGVFVADV